MKIRAFFRFLMRTVIFVIATCLALPAFGIFAKTAYFLIVSKGRVFIPEEQLFALVVLFLSMAVTFAFVIYSLKDEKLEKTDVVAAVLVSLAPLSLLVFGLISFLKAMPWPLIVIASAGFMGMFYFRFCIFFFGAGKKRDGDPSGTEKEEY